MQVKYQFHSKQFPQKVNPSVNKADKLETKNKSCDAEQITP